MGRLFIMKLLKRLLKTHSAFADKKFKCAFRNEIPFILQNYKKDNNDDKKSTATENTGDDSVAVVTAPTTARDNSEDTKGVSQLEMIQAVGGQDEIVGDNNDENDDGMGSAVGERKEMLGGGTGEIRDGGANFAEAANENVVEMVGSADAPGYVDSKDAIIQKQHETIQENHENMKKMKDRIEYLETRLAEVKVAVLGVLGTGLRQEERRVGLN